MGVFVCFEAASPSQNTQKQTPFTYIRTDVNNVLILCKVQYV
jgi:hypothetical protein